MKLKLLFVTFLAALLAACAAPGAPGEPSSSITASTAGGVTQEKEPQKASLPTKAPATSVGSKYFGITVPFSDRWSVVPSRTEDTPDLFTTYLSDRLGIADVYMSAKPANTDFDPWVKTQITERIKRWSNNYSLLLLEENRLTEKLPGGTEVNVLEQRYRIGMLYLNVSHFYFRSKHNDKEGIYVYGSVHNVAYDRPLQNDRHNLLQSLVISSS